jgi:hypothetical protein
MKRLIFLCAVLSLSLLGCGGGGGTSGSVALSTLTVEIQGGGTYLLTGTATFTPPPGKSPVGTEMKITADMITTTFSQTVSLDSTGTAQIAFSASQPTTLGVAMVDVAVGDLKAHKEVVVAAYP